MWFLNSLPRFVCFLADITFEQQSVLLINRKSLPLLITPAFFLTTTNSVFYICYMLSLAE